MDSGADGLRATSRASSRALRPMRAPRENGNCARDSCTFGYGYSIGSPTWISTATNRRSNSTNP
eukprot:6213106-Lingulodinium_polyedra.AAC.1